MRRSSLYIEAGRGCFSRQEHWATQCVARHDRDWLRLYPYFLILELLCYLSLYGKFQLQLPIPPLSDLGSAKDLFRIVFFRETNLAPQKGSPSQVNSIPTKFFTPSRLRGGGSAVNPGLCENLRRIHFTAETQRFSINLCVSANSKVKSFTLPSAGAGTGSPRGYWRCR